MTAPSATKADALDFPAEIKSWYRVRRERLGPGEYDVTIPLTGDRGFVYVYGPGWFGVWLTSKQPNKSINVLQPKFPNMIVQQVGDNECTFRIPGADLERACERLGAYRRRKLSETQRRQCADRLKPHQFHARQSAKNAPESTQPLRDVV